MRLLAILCLSVFFNTTSAQWKTDSDAELCLLGSGDLTIDIITCSRAIESDLHQDWELASLYGARGRALYYQQQMAQAEADLDQAIALNPQSPFALNHRGLVAQSKGRYEVALDYHNRALALNPGYHEALRYRAHVHHFSADYEQARSEYDAILQIYPNDPEALAFRGFCHYRLGHFDDASADFAALDALNYPYLYIPIWRHLAAKRAGRSNIDILPAALVGVAPDEWPNPLIAVYLEQTDAQVLLAELEQSSDPLQQHRLLESLFYLGEWFLLRDKPKEANDMLQTVVRFGAENGLIHSVEYSHARSILEH